MLYDPERRWWSQAACRGQPTAAAWFADGGTPDKPPSADAQALWDEAKKVCRRCPVMHQCRRDTLGEEYGVWGGYDQRQRYLIRQKLPKAAEKWPRERRLAWGQALSEYRDRDPITPWIEVRRITGIPARLADELVTEWRAHVKAQNQQAEILHLLDSAPELSRGEPAFPDAKGRLDAWVRHNGLIGDGHYQGETADGLWLLMNVRSGKSRVRKWVQRRDVQFHDPKPPLIMEYEGRPDRARDQEPAA